MSDAAAVALTHTHKRQKNETGNRERKKDNIMKKTMTHWTVIIGVDWSAFFFSLFPLFLSCSYREPAPLSMSLNILPNHLAHHARALHNHSS